MERPPRKHIRTVVNGRACLAMILVDGTRIRQEIKREYEKVLRDLDKARQQLERFQKEDVPHFSRWLNSRFGTLLTEIRETTNRIHELEQLFLEIETEMLFNGFSPSEAHERVQDRRKNPEPPEDKDDPFSGGRSQDNGHSSQSDPGFEEAEEFFSQFDGFGRRKKPAKSGRNFSTSTTNRLKELYRALARRLHPDVQKDMTSQKQEWWHQAQAAYEKGDVEQLEVILSLCEIEDAGSTEKTSLSLLQRISAQLKKSLRQLKTQLSKCRRDPAWDFKARKDHDAMAATMHRQLTHDLHRMKEQLQSMEQQLTAWTKPPTRRRYSRTQRRPMSNPFDSLF